MKVLACSVIREMIVTALFICFYLKDKLSLSSINCQIHAMTGNCSVSLQVLTNSLQVVSAMTGNSPFNKEDVQCKGGRASVLARMSSTSEEHQDQW